MTSTTFVLSNVTINGGTGTDLVRYSDSADGAGGDTWTLTASSTAKSTRVFSLNSIETQTITGADVSTVYNVDGLGSDTTINAGTADDTFNVGGGDFDSNFISDELFINAGAGTNALSIDDSIDSFDDSYLFNSVAGTFPYVFTKSSEPGSSINWNANILDVDLTANTGSNVIEFGAPGAFLVSQDFDVFGGDGNDTLRIGNGSNGIANMDANVLFDGQAGNDTFDYLAQNVGAIAIRTFNNSTLTGGTGGVFTAGLGTEVFNLVLGSGNDIVDANSVRSSLTLAVVGNGGDDTLNVAAASNDFDTFISGVLTFSGGVGGFDRILLDDTGDGGDDPYDITSVAPDLFTPASSHDFTKEIGGTLRFFNDVELFDLDANAGNNTISLLGNGGLPANLDLNVNGGGGDDDFVLGDGSTGIAFYDADLIFNGGAGNDSAIVQGQGLVGSTYTVTTNLLTNQLLINGISYSLVEDVVVNAGNSNDTVNVQSLTFSTDATINTGNGNDTVNVGNANTVELVDGTVDVNMLGGNDTLNYNDAANGFGDTYILDGFNISRNSSGTVTWDSNANTVNVFGGSVANTFNINVSTFVDYNVFGGGGDDIVNVNNALGFGIDLDTQAGNDDVFINTDNSSLARVTFAASDSLDVLQIGDGGEVDIAGGGDKVLQRQQPLHQQRGCCRWIP